MEYQRKPIGIKGWEEYECDTNGVVYSKVGKPRKYSINHNGYCIVGLHKPGIKKGFGIHTLIAKTFIPNPDPATKTQVNHKNGNNQDNSVENLEWVTTQENMDHARDVLGIDRTKINNHNSKEVWAYHKKTGELIYHFDCVMNAARFFLKDNYEYKKARRIQNIISQNANGKGHYKSYRGCLWTYSKREEKEE